MARRPGGRTGLAKVTSNIVPSPSSRAVRERMSRSPVFRSSLPGKVILPSPWSSPRGSVRVKISLPAPKAGAAVREIRRAAAKAWERLNRMMSPKKAKQGGHTGPPLQRFLEPDLHEHLQAFLGEVPLEQAVPAAEATLEAGGADGHAEVVGDPRVRELRHVAAAEVGGEGAPVVLEVGAEFRRPEGVVGVGDQLVLVVLPRGQAVE